VVWTTQGGPGTSRQKLVRHGAQLELRSFGAPDVILFGRGQRSLPLLRERSRWAMRLGSADSGFVDCGLESVSHGHADAPRSRAQGAGLDFLRMLASP